MSQMSRIAAFVTVIHLIAAARISSADEVAEKGRAVLEKYKSTVVTVQLLIKQKVSMSGFPNDGNESKSEIAGTVIDPSGLTVVSLMSTDPGSMFEEMMGDMSDGPDSEFKFNFKMSSEVVSVKILLEGGKELPAQIVLRDKDLDLAFIRPIEKPAESMPALKLSDSAQPKILDGVISISRLGKVAGRVPSVNVGRVEAVIQKPRTLYVATMSGFGSPVFALDGKLIGIEVMRMIKSSDRGGFMGMMSGGNDNMLPVIVPASDIAEGAAQAPMSVEVKPEAKSEGNSEGKAGSKKEK